MGLIMMQVFRAAGRRRHHRDRPADECAVELASRARSDASRSSVQEDAVAGQGHHRRTRRRYRCRGRRKSGHARSHSADRPDGRQAGSLRISPGITAKSVDWGWWNWMAFEIINGHTRNPAIYVEGIRIGIGMLEQGTLDMRSLVTHHYSLDDINEGFRTAAAKPEGFRQRRHRVRELTFRPPRWPVRLRRAMKILRSLSIALLLLRSWPFVLGQGQGRIAGTVTDDTGDAVARASTCWS
jgi:hypothetical protein